jgi:ketosteroid isomerase-like protein
MPDSQARANRAPSFLRDQAAATRELISRLHQARWDHEAFVEFFREDCAFRIIGQVPDYPFSGVYVGKRGVRDLLRRIDDQIEMTDGKILNLLIDGDQVALRRSVVVRHHGTAARTRLFVANVITLQDGRVREICEHIDTAWLKKLAGD